MTTPAWGEVISLNTDNWLTLPDTPVPYYVHAKNGMYLHRRNANGRGLVRTYKTPAKLQPVSHDKGIFEFDGVPLPASIYAQAVSFFRRIFNTHGTEAEVVITQNIETKAYRLYVPTQRVSHGGVYSIYDPSTISQGYLVVGTIHSHCDFSAFHSSTDEGDARDMDGVHLTVGKVNDDEPEVAAMVALHGLFFDYADISILADTTDLTAASAPDWWDRYVILGTVTDADRQRLAPYADDETWERFMGRYRRPQPVFQKPPVFHPKQNTAPTWNKPTPMRDWGWDDDGGLWWDPEAQAFVVPDFGLRALPAPKGLEPDPYWETDLGKDYVNDIFDTGLFTEEDLTLAIDCYPESGTKAFWERMFLEKYWAAAEWLTTQGVDLA